MTELAFLLDLLLEHKLSAPTRKAITERIKFVEMRLSQGPAPRQAALPVPAVLPTHMIGQSASTIQAMLRHEQLGGQQQQLPPPRADEQAIIDAQAMKPESPTVTIVAQTPQAVAAVNARQEAISIGLSGKPAKGETRPRKW